MHLNDEIKNNNDVINFYYRVYNFFTFINMSFINSATFIKDNSLTLILFFLLIISFNYLI